MKDKYFHLLSISRGYTLIELMVVIVILVILSGIGLASLSSYGKRQVVEQAAVNVKTSIDRARFNALSYVKPPATSGCTTANILIRYEFKIVDAKTYQVYPYCDNGPTAYVISKLPQSVSFSAGVLGCIISYSVINNTALASGCAGAGGDIASIGITGGGITKTIVVSSSGISKVL